MASATINKKVKTRISDKKHEIIPSDVVNHYAKVVNVKTK